MKRIVNVVGMIVLWLFALLFFTGSLIPLHFERSGPIGQPIETPIWSWSQLLGALIFLVVLIVLRLMMSRNLKVKIIGDRQPQEKSI